jgi:hypothetical protein
MTWKEETMYKIRIDYSTTLKYTNYDDFENAIGMLFHGGAKKLEIEEVIDDEEVCD